MNISVAIMAHPSRKQHAEALAKRLKTYPFSVVHIVWDQRNDEWDTGSRALRVGDAVGSSWHIVLQDDAILSDSFYDHIESAIEYVPAHTLISLYTGTVRPFGKRVTAAIKKAKHVSWLKSDLLLWGVGILIPTRHIEPVLEFIEGRDELYDFRIGYAFQRQRLPIYYTNPSLVNHNDDLGTLVGTDKPDYLKKPRVAHNFAADKPIKWNSDVITI